MIEFPVGELCAARQYLLTAKFYCSCDLYHKPPEESVLSKITREAIGGEPELDTSAPKQFNDTGVRDVKNILGWLERSCQAGNLSHSLQIIQDIRLILDGKLAPAGVDAVLSQLNSLDASMVRELKQRKFAYIPMSRQEFFENAALFGEKVNDAFPSAVSDIKQAGNSFAADLPTATVFHLMRVAEHGLRSLAKHLKVKVKDTPLEYAEWHKILQVLEAKVIKITQSKGRGKKKQDALEFYQGAVLELRALKDVYRNNVSHCRTNYDEHQSKSAIIHVQRLMETLATRLSEPKKVPGWLQ